MKIIKKGFYNIISDIYLCKKFTNTLLHLTSLRKTKWLNAYHFKLINDKSFFHGDLKMMQQTKSLKTSKTFKFLSEVWWSFFHRIYLLFTTNKIWLYFKRMKYLIEKFAAINIYDPTKKFTILWDFIIMILILYFFIIIPFELTFFDSSENLPDTHKKYFLIFLLLDILKSFNTITIREFW